ncbi:sensor histidine kinase [Jiulongibacter sp. NS-SX5]|uniref:sensor histidine kinase n=1 Tax=Jiulongibacter sp. NS-SX5 TaxID=3463854 RepID=UPI0040589BAE
MNFEAIRSFLKDNQKEIRKHLLAWTLYYLVDFIFVFTYRQISGGKFLASYFTTLILFTSSFYSVVGVLYRNLPRKKIQPFLVAILIVMGFAYTNYLISLHLIKLESYLLSVKESVWRAYLFEVWRFSTSAFYAFAFWIYLQRIKEQDILFKTEQQLLKTELNFLKAQINPHFLFNTLNFVYGEVAPHSEKSGKAIIKLTNLMRYSVESTKREVSNLKKEIDAIDEYIELQKARFSDKVAVRFDKEGLFPFFALPPLVLMSLVENAFKYGVIDEPNNPIHIKLKVSQEKLEFICRNKKRKDFQDKETTAVGIENIKRRLQLVYDDNYAIDIDDSEHFYEVKLSVLWKK